MFLGINHKAIRIILGKTENYGVKNVETKFFWQTTEIETEDFSKISTCEDWRIKTSRMESKYRDCIFLSAEIQKSTPACSTFLT